MTGPEHYRAAEHLIERVEHLRAGSKEAVECLARAQVNATLALAAATALGSTDQLPDDDFRAWRLAASEKPAADKRRRKEQRAEQADEWDSLDSNAYQDRLEAEGGAA